jgi:hypothetical protein
MPAGACAPSALPGSSGRCSPWSAARLRFDDLSMCWSSLPLPLTSALRGRAALVIFVETRPGNGADARLLPPPRGGADRSHQRAGAGASESPPPVLPSARPDTAPALWGAGKSVGTGPVETGGKLRADTVGECDRGGDEGRPPPTLEWNSCDIEAIEAGVNNASLARLERVSLQGCRLREFPPVLCRLPCLSFLNFGGTNLSTLPECVAGMRRLRVLFFLGPSPSAPLTPRPRPLTSPPSLHLPARITAALAVLAGAIDF